MSRRLSPGWTVACEAPRFVVDLLLKYNRSRPMAVLAALLMTASAMRANPTGGNVAVGSATISTTPGGVTVNQLTGKAVINWQTFSIGAGEATKFIQPSTASATLNRVLGGQKSIIDGSLTSNGQIFLLNGNGIFVGPSGVVNTGGFVASTRALSDDDFAAGNFHFSGNGEGGVTNLGKVSALGGDVIFIGKTVDNQGEITASMGHVGLAAGDDVMISQAGMEHLFVRSTSGASSATGQTAVNNSGTILAASAELKAANGNIYALATNNSGIIRATGVTTEGGHIWLIAEGNHGVTQNTGTLSARDVTGTGGKIETSGGKVVAHGTVDAGSGGTWLIDPSDITIDSPTAATLVSSLNGGATVTEDSSVGTGGSGDITVTSAISWTGTGTLNLYAYRDLNINTAITSTNGSLAVKSGTGGSGVVNAPAVVNVKNFALQGGSWIQNADTLSGHVLPAFTATNFKLTSGAFLRVAGGSGTSADPYQLSDVYGLQGVGSSSGNLSAAWRVSTAIDASGTSGWNAGAGFVPIGSFTGSFNGNGAAISGLVINTPAATNVGLFGQVGAAGSVRNVILSNVAVTGLSGVGALVGSNAGSVQTSSASGAVTGTNSASSLNIGGLVGLNSGGIESSSVSTSVTGYSNAGGLAGNNSGAITSSFSTGTTTSFLNGSLAGNNLGALVGLNNGGTVTLAYTTGSINAPDTAKVGGLVGGSTGSSALIQQSYTKGSTVVGYSQVGGLVGSNGASASITGSKLIDGTGNAAVTGTVEVGGLVGNNAGSITQSSVLGAGAIRGQDGAASANRVGGFVGVNSGTVSNSFVNIVVGQVSGTTDTQYVGGFAGLNTSAGSISGIYSSGNVSGAQNVGGLVGSNDGTLGIQSNAGGTVSGTTNVGGLAGANTGTIGAQSYATGAVSGTTAVGGLIGSNNTAIAMARVYAKGNVSGTTSVGGLIGTNLSGDFSASNASGTVTGTGSNIGGLMGQSAGALTTSAATGNVNASGASNVGGLVGNNSGSIFSVSSATGNVLGGSAVGGLIGLNSGTVGDALSTVDAPENYTRATGSVTGLSNVGGLIGDNSGTVRQTWASGAVAGNSTSSSALGGLVGRNGSTGTVTVSYSNSTVYGNGTASTNGAATDTQIGGLVGANLGAISHSYASGAVVGDNNAGGLVGLNNASSSTVQTSYSTGNVTGLVATGGLIGYNQLGAISQNYSTSAVSGGTNVGGLVGLNGDRVSENYATGTVAGTVNVGGLIGQIASGGTLTQSYATGAVTSSGVSGGLVGLNGGTVTNSYWDSDATTKGAVGIGSGTTTGATGLTSNGGSPTAFSSGSYSGFGTTGSVSGGAANVVQFTDSTPATAWYMLEGATRPYLSWEGPTNNLQISGAYQVFTAHQLQLLSVNLGASYVVAKNIDLSETQQASGLWNRGTGFVPIGTASSPFSGALSGGGFGISNLSINTPSISNVGLFGASTGSLTNLSLSGSVTGLNGVGLLVGLNQGQVTDARLSGTVTGTQSVGGLAGENQSDLKSAAVNVTVNGNNRVGGLVGYNNSGGTIEESYALGAVNGTGSSPSALGGLAGLSSGTVTISYATGAVTGGASSTDVGGAIGRVTGAVNQTFSAGAVSGGAQVGGVAGSVANGGSLRQSYSTGAVNGASLVGGVVGSIESGGSVTRSYSSSAVTGTDSATTGGVIGQVAAGGTSNNLFWDSTRAATAVGAGTAGSVTDLHGKTVNADTALYAGLDSAGSPGFTAGFNSSPLVFGSADSIWRAQTGSEFPFLTQLSTQISGTSYTTEAHTTPINGATVRLNSGSNVLATTTTNGAGAYDFLFAADDGLFNYLPQTGKTFRISESVHSADSIAAKLYNGNGVPNLLANITPADTWGNTVRVVSSGLDNSLLTQAGSSFISNPGGNSFGGANVSISENFNVASGLSGYGISGDIVATGNVSFDSPGQVPSTYGQPVILNATGSAGNTTPTFTLNAGLSSPASNRSIVVESDGKFVNNVGTSAFSTPSGTWIVYSQNPEGSAPVLQDQNGGLNQLHLYGTNYTQTPAYLLSPGLNYQVYTFTPTLTLTAVATGADSGGTLGVQYGTATPSLSYTVSGLLSGDTVAPGGTFNQVLSNQPGQQTTYAKYSAVGNYPVTFTASTLPTSLIGYNLVFASGSINVTQNTDNVNIQVTGSQPFAYQGGTAAFNFSATGSVSGDPNFHPTFATSVGQYANVNRDGGGAVIPYANTISFNTSSLSNYANVSVTTVDNGFTVLPAAVTVSATGTSIYGNAISTPSFTSNGASSAGTIYDNSGTGSTVAISTLGYGATPAATTASHVGSYSIALTGTSGTSTSGALSNYNVTVSPGTYSITKRNLVIDATQNEQYGYDGTPGTTTFGATDYSIGATSSGTGLVNGDVITGLMGRVTNTNSNVGHYNYTVGTLGTADSGNTATSDYTFAFANHGFGLDIAPRAITVGALNNETKVYGNADPNTNLASTIYGVIAGSLASGENFASTGALGRQTGEAVNGGTPYLFNAIGSVGIVNGSNASTLGNYTVTFSNLSNYGLTITPAPLTVTAVNDTKTYNGNAYSGGHGVTFSGFKFTDTSASLGGSVSYTGTSQGAINVGSYVITPQGYTSGNYTIGYADGSLTVNKAPLTVTASNQSKTYGGSDPTLTFVSSGTLYGSDTYSVISGVSLSTTTGSAATAGTHAIVPTGGTASNYSINNVNGTLTVAKASLTATADDKSKTYGGTSPTLTYTPSGTLFYSDAYSVISGVSLSTTTGAAATAGTHAITATGGTATNYTITGVPGTLTVSKASLTATAVDKTTTYGTSPTLTYAVSGTLFYTDTASVVSGVSLATTTGAAAVVGTYAITATGGTATNYNITDANGTLTVNKAPLTVTANNQSKTYGGSDPTLTFAPSGTLYYTDDYSVISGVSLSTTTGSAATAGTHAIVPTGGTASNYSISNVNGTLTVAKASLTATADDKSKTYGGTDPTLTFTPSGTLYYSDAYSVISGVSLATTTGAAATAGTHAITATGGTASNYTITGAPGTLTVGKASLTATAVDKTTTYGTTPTLTYAVSGTLFYTDTASVVSGVSLATTTGAAAVVGTYPITATGGTAANYTINDVNGTLTVGKASLTVTADNQSKTYGAADPSLTFTPSGTLFYGDLYSVISGVSLSTTTGSAATAGTHSIVATGGTATNYNIIDANGTLTVGKATLTANADNQAKTYGAADPTLTFTPSGTLFYGDLYSVISGVSLSTTTGSAATAGTHAIVASGGTATNYTVVDANGTLTVGKASLTATANDQTKTYGGADPSLTYTPSGTLFYSDAYSVISGVSLSTTTGAAATAGTHAIVASGGTAANYTVVDANGTLTVGKASLTATANNQSKTYGGADPTLTFTPSGTLFYGDLYSVISGVSLSTTTGSAATAGTHAIVASGGTASNYNVVGANGTLTVGKATLTATADNAAKTYGAADPTLTFTPSGTLFYGDLYSVISGVSLSTTTGAAATAGTHAIVASGGTASNYNVVGANGTLTVGKATLAATADNAAKTYGAADPTLTFTPSGTLFYGDLYSVISGVSLSTTTGSAATAGTHAIVAAGGTAANYNVVGANGTLTVGKATLTATADNAAKTYGAADPTLTFTPTGTLFYGDLYSVVSGVSLSTTTGSAATAGTHAIVASGGTAANYSIVDANGTLTVGKASLTATADNQSKLYGGVEPTLTYTPSGTLFYGDAYNVISSVGLATTTGAAATAGTHAIVATGGTAANYNVVAANGTLTVGKSSLTVTADNQSKTYGASDPTLTFTSSGTLFYGDAYSVISGVSLATTTGASATAGTHTITPSGGTAANYTVVNANGTLTVAKAILTATADNQSKIYGAAEPTLTFTPSGTLYYGDAYNVISGVSLATTTGAAATAGTHAIVASGGTANNYTIVGAPGTLTVGKASLTATADNQSTIYGTAPTLSYTASGTLYYGDTYNVISGVNLATTTGAAAVVGTHAIVASGGTAANYNVTDGNGTLTIGKATLTATADNQSKIYGGVDPLLTYSISGPLFYGDLPSVVTGVNLATATGAAATAGSHVITATGGTSANYNVVDANGSLTVGKAPITVTAQNQSKTYGGADPTLTYTTTGTLFYGDIVNVVTDVSLSSVTGAAATAGAHPITIAATGPTAANYAIVDVNGTLTVNKATLTATADNQSKVYGKSDPTLTFTPSGTLYYGDNYNVITGVSLATTTGSNATAGTHAIVATGGTAANYNVVDANGLLTVSQAPLILTSNPQSKFSGVNFLFKGTEFTTSGLVGSDSVSQIGLTSSATPVSALPGSYAINFTPDSAAGTGLSNYAITFVSSPFTVVPGSLSQLPVSWTTRGQLNQVIAAQFNAAAYGERERFFELGVPGTIRRVVPSAPEEGMGAGSSLVDVQIGLEGTYSLDRFQSFRH